MSTQAVWDPLYYVLGRYFWNLRIITILVVMSSTEEYKKLENTTLTSVHLQGILQIMNHISYASFSDHDNDFPDLQNCNSSDNICTRNYGTS